MFDIDPTNPRFFFSFPFFFHFNFNRSLTTSLFLHCCDITATIFFLFNQLFPLYIFYAHLYHFSHSIPALSLVNCYKNDWKIKNENQADEGLGSNDYEEEKEDTEAEDGGQEEEEEEDPSGRPTARSRRASAIARASNKIVPIPPYSSFFIFSHSNR